MGRIRSGFTRPDPKALGESESQNMGHACMFSMWDIRKMDDMETWKQERRTHPKLLRFRSQTPRDIQTLFQVHGVLNVDPKDPRRESQYHTINDPNRRYLNSEIFKTNVST